MQDQDTYESLKKRIKELEENISSISNVVINVTKLLEQNMILSNNNQFDIKIIDTIVGNIKYEVCDPTVKKPDYFYPKFRSNEETLRLICEEHKSLGRFGDGEFSVAFDFQRQKFQKCDKLLADRIRQVLHSELPDYIVAIANHYGNLDRFNVQASRTMRIYLCDDIRAQHRELLSEEQIYSDAYITRPYVMMKDLYTDAPAKRFKELKRIWDDKKICIVEGSKTRLGVGNDLFSNAADIKRILAPATNSFDRYDDIMKESLKVSSSVDMFILAIGPSSGILAYDLCENGIQAVDVGHIDLEYEWFLAGKGERVPVPHKYNNEVDGGDTVDDEGIPEEYFSQIYADLSK